MLGMVGIERRIQVASESGDNLLLSFIAQDVDSRVRQAVSQNPNTPRILRDAIRGTTDYSPEEASGIWFDVWKTDPEEFLDEHRSGPGLPNVLLARGYFAEDFDDADTALRWFRAASSIGVQQGHVNIARLSADENGTRTDPNKRAIPTGENQGIRVALVPVAVSVGLMAVVIALVMALQGT